jgi:hypothetical protein
MGGRGMSEYTYGNFMFVLVMAFLISLFISSMEKQKLREEAVERGFAEYIVNKSGETTWKWKETK